MTTCPRVNIKIPPAKLEKKTKQSKVIANVRALAAETVLIYVCNTI